eukprot:CAMPEP_0182896404 /NCGR_PEP_ID=MMETSP0034_2-20130328/26251_1 /TAXON_ID=156128 /ORGANISM="Nephroselmis pyriformis, Strain CCMP717" /LENGTH=767 /DNA_ID=CAMNT_0025030271 /DNA_START=72 /DNA_END=2375 /DNA_ORIENTATION=-
MATFLNTWPGLAIAAPATRASAKASVSPAMPPAAALGQRSSAAFGTRVNVSALNRSGASSVAARSGRKNTVTTTAVFQGERAQVAVTTSAPNRADAQAVYNIVAAEDNLDTNSPYCYMLAFDHHSDECIVARDSATGNVVGFVMAHVPPKKPDTLFVWQVAVADVAKGSGIGLKMLRDLQDRVAQRGVQFMECTITPSNEASRSLFLAFARETKSEIVATDAYMPESDFPMGMAHEGEDLYTIGPINGDVTILDLKDQLENALKLSDQPIGDLVNINPQDEEYKALVAQLEEQGSTLASHVSMTNHEAEGKLHKCPFLMANPILKRQAERESNARSYARGIPISIAKAKGSIITDPKGTEWIDGLACAGTLALGHNHPVVIDAVREYLDSEGPMQVLDMNCPAKDKYTGAVLGCLPGDMGENFRLQFCGPAGTDATEAALKIARTATGRNTIATFHGGYHGHSAGALALMGNLHGKSASNRTDDVHFFPFPYAYRCTFGIGKEGWKASVKYLERTLDDVESGIPKPAAVIMECVQGEGGVIPAPGEWMREVRRITEERGILLICDEIQSGFGRTGKMFAFEHGNIQPDMVLMSKAAGGGHPMAVVAYHKSIDKWSPGQHAGTFRGNAIAMVAGAAQINYLKENNMVAESARKGEILRGMVECAAEQSRIIGEVRGRGLMLGVEIVDPRGERDELGALPHGPSLATEIQKRCLMLGLIIEKGGRQGCVVRLLPALSIPDEQLVRMGQILVNSITSVNRDLMEGKLELC